MTLPTADTTLLETPWVAGTLGSRKGPKSLLFGQMYEDAEIDRAAFQNKHRIFCIASASSTALHLAQDHEVVACDINPVQLAYAQRRATGGPVLTGDAERAMAFARVFMPLIGWRQKQVRTFLALSNLDQQTEFFHQQLDTARFRTGFDTLLSRPLLRAVYNQAFLSFLPPNFGSVVRHRLERGFATHPNVSNPYARALLLGEFIDPPAPNNPNIHFVLGDAAAYLEACPPHSFDGFSLSNILDGAKAAYCVRLARAVQHAAAPNATVILRSFAERSPNLVTNHAAADRSMLWGIVDIRSAQSF